jgi:HK97 family phage major capsid protein
MEEKDKKNESVEKAAEQAAEKIIASLGLEKMQSELDALKAKDATRDNDAIMKVFVSEDVEKSISELTSKEKVDAYSRALMTGDLVSLKALSEGVSADGGYTVPQDFYNTLLEQVISVAQFRSEVTVIPMKGPVLTLTMIDHGPDVFWTAEGATKTTTTADFTQPTLTAYKLAAIIYLTDELIEDSAFSLSEVLVRRFAKKMAEAEDKAIVQGTGSGQPTGLFTATPGSTRTAPTGLTFDVMIDLIMDLPVEYRAGAKFVINSQNIRELRKVKDTTGRYIWADGVQPGQPATILGYPVIETPWAPESKVLFGNLREAYWLGDRQRMTVKITQDTETAFTQDKTAIRVVERVGGTVVFARAIATVTSIP